MFPRWWSKPVFSNPFVHAADRAISKAARAAVRCTVSEPLERRILFSAPTQWSSRGVGGGGAFFAPSFSPTNASELYVSSDMSGLYHSTNLGASWSLGDFNQIQANRGSQVQFTSDPNTLYTLDYREDFDNPTQVTPTKSTDGGAHWSQLAAWDTQVGNDAYGLWADPTNTSNLLVTDYGSLYFSNNGGQTFSTKFTAPNSGQGCYVGGVFFDGAGDIYVGTSAGLLISNNNGASFALSSVGGITAGEAIWSLSGARQNGITRLMCVTVTSGDVYNGAPVEDLGQSYGGVYSLDVGQANWSLKSGAIPAGEFPHWISMARGDINTAYLAGTDSSGSPSVLKTTNAGGSWSDVLRTLNNANVATGWQGQGGDRGWGFGETAMAFEVAPNDPNTLAFTDFGYVHVSTDGGATWRQAYVNPADQNAAGSNTPQHKAYRGVGLEDTSALWLQWADSSTVVAGYTDIYGTRSTDSGASWAFPTNISLAQNTVYQISSLSTGSVPSGEILYAAASNTHDLYQSTHITDASIDSGSGRVLFSTDKGATWATLHDFGHPVIYTALDPTNTNRMYASVVSSSQGGIYITNNLSAGTAATWSKVVANPPRTAGHPYNIKVLNDGTLVVTYSARRTTQFTASSGVFVSTDQGQTWADRTLMGAAGFPGMQYWTKDLTVDPTDAAQNTWWAAVRSGFGGNGNDMGGLYKTTDRGLHWTRVFSADSVESVTINADPTIHEMYVSTLSSGLWYSTNFNAASPTFTQTTYLFRQPERVFINPSDAHEVWVTSFGYGSAVGRTASGPAVQSIQIDNGAAQRSAVRSVTVTFDRPVTLDPGALTLAGRNGASAGMIVTQANPSSDGRTYVLTFSGTPIVGGSLADGIYDLTVKASAVKDATTGATAASDVVQTFHRLFGDINGDKTVNNSDAFQFNKSYLKNAGDPAFLSAFDYNGDNTDNNADAFQFNKRYLLTLAY